MSFLCLFFKSQMRTKLQSSWKNINHIWIKYFNGDWCFQNDVIQGRTVDYDIWVQSPLRCCCFKAEEFSWKNINHINGDWCLDNDVIQCRTVDYDTVGGHIFLRISSTKIGGQNRMSFDSKIGGQNWMSFDSVITRFFILQESSFMM